MGAFLAISIAAILFVILNYFNIISLSSYPPLSFLPHQASKTNLASPDSIRNLASQTQKGVSNSTSQKEAPSPSPKLSPTPILEKTAKDLLTKFFADNLKSSIIPQLSSVNIIQNKPDYNSFDATWQTEAGTASALFAMSQSSPRTIRYLYLEIPFITDVKAFPSVSIAESKYSNFFSIIPQGSWGCKLIKNVTYCENFWEDKDGVRKGIEINGYIVTSNNKIINSAFLCELHKGNGNLYPHKSCLSEFATTGIK